MLVMECDGSACWSHVATQCGGGHRSEAAEPTGPAGRQAAPKLLMCATVNSGTTLLAPFNLRAGRLPTTTT